ncbi:vWA domain-containing protein [Lampropedia puyangensis]|uniref:vWA domain-containing protein n=1 Tax=Lampropedia puyangensis TaxID=1330072 RepID=UPI001B86554A|nr:magnesium chelatase [Lampropedia puyangensis]
MSPSAPLNSTKCRIRAASAVAAGGLSTPNVPTLNTSAMGSWDWPQTLRQRGAEPLRLHHLQRKPALAHETALHCIVLDCSASMRQTGALAHAKGLLLALLAEAYQARAHAALFCFGGQGVQLQLPPQRPPAWNDAWLAPIGGGGHSPLAQAVTQADELLRNAHRYAPAQRTLWLLSDGRVAHLPERPTHTAHTTLVDCERNRIPLARMTQLAQRWQCSYLHLDQLAPPSSDDSVHIHTTLKNR